MIVELYLLRSSLITNKELVMSIANTELLNSQFLVADNWVGTLEALVSSEHEYLLMELNNTGKNAFFSTRQAPLSYLGDSFVETHNWLIDTAYALINLEDDLDHAVYSQYQLVWQTMMSRYNACKKHYAQDVTLRINFRR